MIQNVWHGDCLELMEKIPDSSVDLVLCDMPYGTTRCKWDSLLDLSKIWTQYRRIAKQGCPIVLFSANPFTPILINSNLQEYKYSWVWDKVRGVGCHVAKIRPLQRTEDVCVFGSGKIHYYPIMIPRQQTKKSKEYSRSEIVGGTNKNSSYKEYTHLFPTNVLQFSNASNKDRLHPTQKPVPLLEYLIKTYSQKGDIVLDNCAGSGSTLVAAQNTGRQFIGMEKDEFYYKVILKRLEEKSDFNDRQKIS